MERPEKSQYISELAHLFLCSSDGHVNTSDFMVRLCEILTDEKNQGKYPYFDLYICTKDDRIVTLNSHKTADKSQVIHYLFDLCGCGGYEVYRLTDEGTKGWAATARYFYGIWLYRNKEIDG